MNTSEQTEKTEKTSMLRWLWLSVFLLVLDQITKVVISNTFDMHERLQVLPVFELTLVHNHGAAFSFLADQGGWQRWFLAGISVVISAVLVVWLYRIPKSDKWMAICLAAILGGALGNLVDRVLYGYVVDFLSFHWGDSYYPSFNIADMAISLGAFMMVVDIIRNPNK